MLLVINSNNTNTVFAVFDGETRRGSCRTAPPTSTWCG